MASLRAYKKYKLRCESRDAKTLIPCVKPAKYKTTNTFFSYYICGNTQCNRYVRDHSARLDNPGSKLELKRLPKDG